MRRSLGAVLVAGALVLGAAGTAGAAPNADNASCMGLGSAFYMFFTNRTADARVVAVVARRVVIADWVFTTPTAIIQPATGFYLAHLAGL